MFLGQCRSLLVLFSCLYVHPTAVSKKTLPAPRRCLQLGSRELSGAAGAAAVQCLGYSSGDAGDGRAVVLFFSFQTSPPALPPKGRPFAPLTDFGAAPSGGPQPSGQGCRCSAAPKGAAAPSPAHGAEQREQRERSARRRRCGVPARATPPRSRPAPPRTRALRAREPAAGGDWLPGAPRGPPGRGRPPSAIHGAARLHALRLIHKKKNFIHKRRRRRRRRPGLGVAGAARALLCAEGTACAGLNRARGGPALKDFGARIGEPEAESCCGLGGLCFTRVRAGAVRRGGS